MQDQWRSLPGSELGPRPSRCLPGESVDMRKARPCSVWSAADRTERTQRKAARGPFPLAPQTELPSSLRHRDPAKGFLLKPPGPSRLSPPDLTNQTFGRSVHHPGHRGILEAVPKAIPFSEANGEMPGNEAERVKQGYPGSHVPGRVPPPCLNRLQTPQTMHPALPGELKAQGQGSPLLPPPTKVDSCGPRAWPVAPAPSGVDDSTWCEVTGLWGSHKKWGRGGGVPDRETPSSEQQGTLSRHQDSW